MTWTLRDEPVPTLQDVLVFLRAGVRRALERSLAALRGANVGSPHDACRARAWKLFLTPRMLLARPSEQGAAGRRALLPRVRAREQVCWQRLVRPDVRRRGALIF